MAEPQDARRPPDRQRGGRGRRHRANHGRDGHRQRSGGARHPVVVGTTDRSVREGELRGGPARAARERAVRPRAGRVHGRPQAGDREIRGGPQRHDLPRRDRRSPPHAPGQAPPRAAGRGVLTRRRKIHAARRRADHRGHQPGPRASSAGGAVPGRPLLPPQRCSGQRAAAARADRGDPGLHPVLRPEILQALPPGGVLDPHTGHGPSPSASLPWQRSRAREPDQADDRPGRSASDPDVPPPAPPERTRRPWCSRCR